MYTRSVLAAGALLLATLGCREDIVAPTGPSAPTSQANVAASAALAFWQLSAAGIHTCGVTTDNQAYCWGDNGWGQLGDGTTGGGRLRPVAVATTLRFQQVSAGGYRACAVTGDYQAYCWGNGPLGDGGSDDSPTPVPVAGGIRFRQIDVGYDHICAVSYPDRRAYCWGNNADGQLGTGTTTPALTPVPLAGTRQFRHVSVGYLHSCAVTTDDRVFCWGSNRRGQIGDSSTAVLRRRPTLIAGGRQYRQVDAGQFHSCAVTTTNRAFCWGDGSGGQLGNGRSYLSFWPRRVAGDLYFSRVSAGWGRTCGETTSNRAYCWGEGIVGDGTYENRSRPVAVLGGLAFAQISAGGTYSCGRTTAAQGYCWGSNLYGRLGDGTTEDRLVPTPVAGPI